MIEIIIDCKENQKFISILQNSISCQVKSLDISDIAFKYKDNFVLYIERKTINDLAASLNDGRYHEQKARLKGNRCLYLIEGSYVQLDKTFNKTFDIEKYKGVIINTMVRDKIPIYQTQNMEESAEFIKDIYKRLPKYINLLLQSDDKNIFNNLSQSDILYSNSLDNSTLKSKKKDNITSSICFINQLRQIPGVSVNIGQVIANEYQNMSKLVEKYQQFQNQKDKEILLRDLKFNNRKIGPVVSKRVYEYLFM